MEKYGEMKKFVSVALKYLRHRSDLCLSDLQKQLELIANTAEISTFDPASSVATDFYVNLNEVMSTIEPTSPLVWSAVAVLQRACKNANAKESLIHIHKFIAILSRCLAVQHSPEKQQKLLRLLLDLTYGTIIYWQEAHLPNLMSALVGIVEEGDRDAVPLALGVLVNLCYKNLPALYVLLGKVNISVFIKKMMKCNLCPLGRIYVCKLLIIFEQTKGDLPEQDILNFIDVVFSTIFTAFTDKDDLLLRQTVDLFKDMKENVHFRSAVMQYNMVAAKTKRLINMLADDQEHMTHTCISLILQLLPSVMELGLSEVDCLYPTLIATALQWVEHEETATQSLKVLQSIVEQVMCGGHVELRDGIIDQLRSALARVLAGLGSNSPANCHQLTATLALLTAMSTCSDLRKEIIAQLNIQVIANMLDNLLREELAAGPPTVFQVDVSELCLEALTLVSTLATFSSDWMTLYVNLLKQRQLQVALAMCLYAGARKMKRQVLLLVSSPGWTNECVNTLCDVMAELHPTTFANNRFVHPSNTQHISPIYTCTQEAGLDEVIAALLQAKQRGELQDMTMTTMMEVFEHKVAAVEHAERRLQASLQAADTSCVSMSNEIAQFRAQVLRLNQILFHKQQCIDGATLEKKELLSKLQHVSEQLIQDKKDKAAEVKQIKKLNMEMQQLLKQHQAELEVKTKELSEEVAKATQLQEHLQVSQQEAERLQTSLTAAQKHIQELTNANITLEEKLSCSRVSLLETEAKVVNLTAENRELRKSLGECMELSAQKDVMLQERDKAITDMKVRVEDLERIREIVINVAAGKKGLERNGLTS